MRATKIYGQRGVSATELLFAATILMAVSALAALQFGSAQSSVIRENLVRQVKGDLDQARADSMRRNVRSTGDSARIMLLSETSYSFAYDRNSDGQINTAETVVHAFSDNSSIRFDLAGKNLPITISYDWLGRCRVIDSTSTPLEFTLRVLDTSSSSGGTNPAEVTTLQISGLGDTKVTNAENASPALSKPSATNVNSNSDIRGDITVTPEQYATVNQSANDSPH